jgi:hypothetical protein
VSAFAGAIFPLAGAAASSVLVRCIGPRRRRSSL